MSTAQRVLLTIAGVILIGVAVYSFVNGEFAELSAFRKSFRIFLALMGVYWLWKAWIRRPPALDAPR